MRKLRLSLVLPPIFFLVSVAVMRWSPLWNTQFATPVVGRVEDLWSALSAPGLFLLTVGVYLADRTPLPQSILHIRFDQFLFIVGGLVFGFLLGKFFDTRKATTSTSKYARAVAIIWNLFLRAWGFYLLHEGFRAITRTDYLGRHLPGSLLGGIFVTAWSALIVLIGGQRFFGEVRNRREARG